MTNLTKATANGKIPFSEEELAEYSATITAWDANSDYRAAAEIRKERDAKLVASDWTQVADAQVDQEDWAAYRQALRDVPSQESFPNEVTWPTEPVEAVAEEAVLEAPVVEVVVEEPVEEVAPE